MDKFSDYFLTLQKRKHEEFKGILAANLIVKFHRPHMLVSASVLLLPTHLLDHSRNGPKAGLHII